jgi:hypothetical protein
MADAGAQGAVGLTMRSVIADISPDGWRSHALHDDTRDWQETNCYVDLWIEVLHARGLAPEAMMGFCVTQDFEGDQFTFFKVPLEDLETLYDIRVGELSIYDSVERHVVEQIGQGRMALVEVDAIHLPDTRGVSYGLEHSKTTIGINVLDADARRLHYFHNAGFHGLEGEDFDGVFQRRDPPGPQSANLFPYVEFARFGDAPLADGALTEAAVDLLKRHLRRAPRANPITAFGRRIEAQAQMVRGREPAFFHKFAFNTLRQLGANFELLSSHLQWLGARGVDALEPAAVAAKELSTSAKAYQFQLARAVTRGKTDTLVAQLETLGARWSAVLGSLQQRFR